MSKKITYPMRKYSIKDFTKRREELGMVFEGTVCLHGKPVLTVQSDGCCQSDAEALEGVSEKIVDKFYMDVYNWCCKFDESAVEEPTDVIVTWVEWYMEARPKHIRPSVYFKEKE